MPDPTTNKPASVQLFALTAAGARVPLRANADGELILAAGVEIDTTGLALNVSVDGLETLGAAGNASTASIDTKLSSQATAAKQDTLLAALQQPTKVTAVTKHDDTDITATASKGLWIGTGGDVAVKGVGDSSATTLLAVPSGTYIPGAYQRVMATNTTASNIASFS